MLGIDLGTKRIGLAVSDEDGRIAFPAGVLERRSKRADFAALTKLVRERGIGAAVVGLPLHMSGRVGPEAEAAKAVRDGAGRRRGDSRRDARRALDQRRRAPRAPGERAAHRREARQGRRGRGRGDAPALDLPRAAPAHGGRVRRLLRWLGALLVLGFALAVAGLVAIQWALAPADPNGAEARFDVKAGSSLWHIAKDLEGAGIVRDARALVALARWRGVDASVRAGEYSLSPAWPTERVLDQLVSGHVITYEVVLPEGLTAVEIAARLEAATLARADEFLAVADDPAVAQEFGVQGTSLEGYLFPETYRMPHGLTAKQVARVLVDEFHQQWKPLDAGAKARGFDMLQTVTLASIVEKETGAAAERPLVASVFWNRLASGMRLESDPTTIYGIKDFDGNLTRAHLEDETNPWNTYRIAGLPPTPIANPGAASLAAVVQPAASDYLYFVARGDGTHVFARSYSEHLANVAHFQRGR